MRTFVRLLAAAALACLAFATTGCASGIPTGGTLGMWGRTLLDEETGAIEGVGVVRLREESPLKEQGVKPGDVIVSVEGKPVGRAAELHRRVFEAGWENSLRLEVRRGDETREIDVLPAPTFRQLRVGIGLWFLWSSEQDVVDVLPLDVFRIGTGPDYKGFMILRCLGFASTPESNSFRLVIFEIGTQYGPPVERPRKKAPVDDPLTIP